MRRDPCQLAVVFFGLALFAVHARGSSTIYSESFDAGLGPVTLVIGETTGSGSETEWHWADACPANCASGHSVPGAARWGALASCDTYEPGGGVDTDYLLTTRLDVTSCVRLLISFNYFADLQQSTDQAGVSVEWNSPTSSGFSGPGNTNAALSNDGVWHAFSGS